MKFRHYLLRTLLLSIIVLTGGGTMWAEDVIYSMTAPTAPTGELASKKTQALTATYVGGSGEVYNGKSSAAAMVSNGQVNLGGSSGSYFHASLNAPLAAGDVISVGASGKMYLSATSSKPNSSSDFPFTVTAGHALIGKKDIYVFKDGIKAFSTFTVTRAEAEDESIYKPVYSWENPSGSVIQTGGTAEYPAGTSQIIGGTTLNVMVISGKASLEGGFAKIELDKPLETGDLVKITGFQNKDATGKTVTTYLAFYSGSSKKAEIKDGANWVNLYNDTQYANGSAPETKYFTVPSAADGSNIVYISRNSAGTNLWVSKVEIVRPPKSFVLDKTTLKTEDMESPWSFTANKLTFTVTNENGKKASIGSGTNHIKYSANVPYTFTLPGNLETTNIIVTGQSNSNEGSTSVNINAIEGTKAFAKGTDNSEKFDLAQEGGTFVLTPKTYQGIYSITVKGFVLDMALSIAEFKALPEGTEKPLKLTDAQITSLTDIEGNGGHVQDASGAMFIKGIYNIARKWNMLNGKIVLKRTADGAEVVDGSGVNVSYGTPSPVDMTLEDVIKPENEGMHVKLSNVTLTTKKDGDRNEYYINQNGKTIHISNCLYINTNGFDALFNGKKQLQSIAGIFMADYGISPQTATDIVAGENATTLKEAANIAAFKALADYEQAQLTLTDAYVTFKNNSYSFLQDATGAIMLGQDVFSQQIEIGKKFSGSRSAELQKDANGVDMKAAKVEGATGEVSVSDQGFIPTEYTNLNDLKNKDLLYNMVRVGRSKITNDGGKKMLENGGNGSIEVRNVLGVNVKVPENLSFITGIVMYADGNYVLAPVDKDSLQEYVPSVTEYKADRQEDGDTLKTGDTKILTGIMMIASGDAPIVADSKTVGSGSSAKNFTAKIQGNDYQFEATKTGTLTVYTEKKAKQTITVTDDGTTMKDFDAVSQRLDSLQIPVAAGHSYVLSGVEPPLNLYGFTFNPLNKRASDYARNIDIFKKLYDGVVAVEDTLKLNDAVVTYIKGDDVFVEDESGAVVLYQTHIQYYKGQVLNGYIVGKSTDRKLMPILQRTDATKYGQFKVKENTTPEPAVLSVADITKKANLARFVKLENVMLSQDKRGFKVLLDTVSGATVRVEDHFNIFYELNDTVKSIEGIVGIDSEGTYQLWPTSKEGVVSTKTVVPDTPVVPEPQPQDGKAVDYSWESPAGTAEEKGGVATYENGKAGENRVNYKNGDYYTICLNGKKGNMNEAASANAGYILISLNEPLKGDETISITAYINKNSSAKSSAWIVYGNGTTQESAVYSDAENIHEDFGGAVTTTTLTVPAEAAGSKTLKLTRSQAGTNLFITKLTIKGQETVDETAGAELVHTASSSCGSDANTYVSTVDAEKEHVNNEKFNAAWQGAAYAEFTFTVPAGETVTNATLKFTAIGESRKARPAIVYVVNAGETLDYTAMAAGDAKVNLAGTKVADITFPHNTSERLEVDVTEALNTIKAAGQNYIIFKITGNPGGGDMVGKGSEDAPELVITSEAGVTGIETVNAPARTAEGVYTLSGQKVGDTTEGLKTGLYIVNGRKVVIK